jgi:DNA-binding CsgD family transcriptional regulator
MQPTSLGAYEDLKPKLQNRERDVLQVFLQDPERDLTNMEVAEILGWSINRVTGRVKNLRERLILIEGPHRKCTVTGNTAIAWRLSLSFQPQLL